MRLVIQRVKHASCRVDDCVISKIKQGLLVFVGIEDADTEQDISYAVRKITHLRIFSDEADKMNLSVKDIPNGAVLSISQFTLFAETRKGNRPSFTKAGDPVYAKGLYDKFNQALQAEIQTVTGIFGADMQIELENDGPVTLIIDTRESVAN